VGRDAYAPHVARELPVHRDDVQQRDHALERRRVQAVRLEQDLRSAATQRRGDRCDRVGLQQRLPAGQADLAVAQRAERLRRGDDLRDRDRILALREFAVAARELDARAFRGPPRVRRVAPGAAQIAAAEANEQRRQARVRALALDRREDLDEVRVDARTSNGDVL
jgi:hypothetical protein